MMDEGRAIGKDEHPRPPATEDISDETLAQAEKLNGFGLSADERQAIRQGVHDRLVDYQRIRQVEMHNDVPPAIQFVPRPRDHSWAELSAAEHRGPTVDLPDVQRPESLEDLAFWPVTHLAALIRSGQLSSLELTRLYIERIKRYNPTLRCVVTLTEDLALSQARRADEELAQGQYRGPLHGIPYGAKDLIATRGYPTSWGAELYKDRIIDLDATVVERLEAAGAVLIAKLSTGTLAHGDVWYGGQTVNPWHIGESAGGSSAGPASATAAGLVGFSIGTETTGSVVWPALRNGVVGLRPTYGLVSRHGAMALSWSMDKVGPLARSVADCALVLKAIYGPDGRDPHMSAAPAPLDFDLDPARVRVGYVKAAFENRELEPWREFASLKPVIAMGMDIREHTANDDRSLETLRSLGYALIPVDLPALDPDPMPIILAVEAAAAFDDLTHSGQDRLLLDSDDFRLPDNFRRARFIPAVEYLQANRLRQLYVEAMDRAMNGVDVIIVPKLGGNNLTLTNLTGHPCVCVPNGFTEAGLPTGIHFIGNWFCDAEMLAVAQALQEATDFHQQRPPMNFT